MQDEELDLLMLLEAVWNRRRLVTAGILLSVALGAVIWFLRPSWYSTSLDLKIGAVWEKPLESRQEVVETINGEPFLEEVRKKSGVRQSARRLRESDAVVASFTPSQGVPAQAQGSLVHVLTRGSTPDEALKLATTTAELVVVEHAVRFSEQMKEYESYEQKLETQIGTIRSEIAELDALIAEQRADPQVDAPAVILLQAQLEARESQLLDYSRELRDVKLHNASKSHSEATRVVLPPVLPAESDKWSIAAYMVAALVIGAFPVCFLAFLIEYIARGREKLRAAKA